MLELLRSVNRAWGGNRVVCAGCALLCVACSPNAPSHLPNPILLPGQAIGTAIENAGYNARRSKVKAHVSQRFNTLRHEIEQGGGAQLTRAFDLARVPQAERSVLTQMLQDDPRLHSDAEALTVTLMVHGP